MKNHGSQRELHLNHISVSKHIFQIYNKRKNILGGKRKHLCFRNELEQGDFKKKWIRERNQDFWSRKGKESFTR